MSLKPQDVCVLLKIVARGPQPWSYHALGYELAMSGSEVHAGVRRAAEAGLIRIDDGWGIPQALALDEFLVHGVRYVWAAERGSVVVGTPTTGQAPGLEGRLPTGDHALPDVWPDPDGDVRGIALVPLYKSVPEAARRDPVFHGLVALVDAIRAHDVALRDAAIDVLRERLGTRPAITAGRAGRAARRTPVAGAPVPTERTTPAAA
jgi:hypothetical protein